MKQVEIMEDRDDWSQLSLVLVDDEGILPAQHACFGKDAPTDVISQSYEAIPPDPPGRIGELVVNVQRAHEVGTQMATAQGPSRELALYVAHGCDHLGGAEDDTPEQAVAMRARETAWLDQAATLDLIDGLLDDEETTSAP